MKTSLKILGLIVATAVTSVVIASSGVTADNTSAKCVDNKYRYGSGYSGGSANYCVKYIQRLSNAIERHSKVGWRIPGNTILKVDGKFGPATASQIRDIQRNSYMLKGSSRDYLSVDGVVGKNTWAVLCGYGSYALSYSARQAVGCVNSRGYGYDQIHNLYPRIF